MGGGGAYSDIELEAEHRVLDEDAELLAGRGS